MLGIDFTQLFVYYSFVHNILCTNYFTPKCGKEVFVMKVLDFMKKVNCNSEVPIFLQHGLLSPEVEVKSSTFDSGSPFAYRKLESVSFYSDKVIIYYS